MRSTRLRNSRRRFKCRLGAIAKTRVNLRRGKWSIAPIPCAADCRTSTAIRRSPLTCSHECLDEHLLSHDLGVNIASIEHHAGINSFYGASPAAILTRRAKWAGAGWSTHWCCAAWRVPNAHLPPAGKPAGTPVCPRRPRSLRLYGIRSCWRHRRRRPLGGLPLGGLIVGRVHPKLWPVGSPSQAGGTHGVYLRRSG